MDRSEPTHEYLRARAEGRGRQFLVKNGDPRTGLYVFWVQNESPFRVRDYQRTPKTEILPLGYSVKAGKFEAGFFQRRGLDDGQLHVHGDRTTIPRPLWRRDPKNNWLVYRDTLRQTLVLEGSSEGEAAVISVVRSWLEQRQLLVRRQDRPAIIAANNAKTHLESISDSDFPNARCEWMHVRRFDPDLFRELTQALH